MNTSKSITRTAIVFAALAIAGISVAFSSKIVADALDQTIMVAIGTAIFGAGSTLFLVRMFALLEK